MAISIGLNRFIVLAAGAMITLSLTVSGLTFLSARAIQTADAQLKVENEFELLSHKAKYHVVQIQQFLTDAALTHDADGVKKAEENLAAFEKDLDEMKANHPQFESHVANLKKLGREVLQVGREMTEAYWASGKAAGDAIMKRPQTGLDASSEHLASAFEELAKKAQTAQDDSELKVDEAATSLKIQTLILSGALIVTVLVMFSLLYFRLKPLTEINSRLTDNAGNLSAAADSMKTSASGMAGINSDQAAATQRTAASLEEIRAMAGKTAENSDRLRNGAETSQKLVKNGTDKLSTVRTQLHEIDAESERLVSDVREGNKEILQIIDIINEIGTKTKVINDIVFQTKLLSFNASVEAARAGEAGKGFAVVAEEVGNLANMSGQAAQEISKMLEQGTSRVETIISSNSGRMEKSISVSKSKIAEGVVTADECQKAFEQIVEQVADVRNVSEEITSAIEEQRKGLDEIGQAISSLESATQSNTTASETVERNSVVLAESVDELGQSIQAVTSIILGESKAGSRTGAVVPMSERPARNSSRSRAA